jgi:SagB-type dehydrogenase family enzyme
MLRYDDPFSLAALFHLNSEPWNNLAAYNDVHAFLTEFKSVGSRDDRIPLPPPEMSQLTALIAQRRCCREFADREITAQQLSDLLEAGYGITGFRNYEIGRVFARAVPSGGGRYPLELYVAADQVAGIPRGLHHYHARDRALEPLFESSTGSELVPDMMQQHYIATAAAIIFLAAVFPRTLQKYGPRGYRYVLMEAGHVAQNICLRAAELGLGSLCLGGFSDNKINKRLKLNEGTEGTVYAVAVGQLSD